jgi:hypothetical protein
MKTRLTSEPSTTSIQFGLMNAWRKIQAQRSELTKPFLPKPGQRLIGYGDKFKACYLITTGSVNEAVPLEEITCITRVLQTGWILFPQALHEQAERYRSHVIVTVNEGTSLQPITEEIAELLQLNIQFDAEREDSYAQALDELNRMRLLENEYERSDRAWLFRYFHRSAMLEERIHFLLQKKSHTNEREPTFIALVEKLEQTISALDEERIRLSATQVPCSESGQMNLFDEQAVQTQPEFKQESASTPQPQGHHDADDGTSMIPLPPDSDEENFEILVEDDEPTQTGQPRLTMEFGSPAENDGAPDSANLPTIRPSASPEALVRTGNTLPISLTTAANQDTYQEIACPEEDVPERRTYFGPEPELHLNDGDRKTIAGMPVADPYEAEGVSSPIASRPAAVSVRRGDLPGSDLDAPPLSRKR